MPFCFTQPSSTFPPPTLFLSLLSPGHRSSFRRTLPQVCCLGTSAHINKLSCLRDQTQLSYVIPLSVFLSSDVLCDVTSIIHPTCTTSVQSFVLLHPFCPTVHGYTSLASATAHCSSGQPSWPVLLQETIFSLCSLSFCLFL